jgi:hemin uptake protein HemP
MALDPISGSSEAHQGGELVPPPASDRIMSRQLLGKKGELIIEHEGREYRLRRTQNGKLILTA